MGFVSVLGLILLFSFNNGYPVVSFTLNDTEKYVTCDDYGEIENANTHIYDSENSLSYQVLHVECNLGYELIGSSQIVCVNGKWDSVPRPQCVSHCNPPPYIKHGLLQIEGIKDVHGKYSKGALAVYSCDKEYQLSPPESRLRVCEMGMWTGPSATCIPAAKSFGCKSPDDIVSGYFVLEKNELDNKYDIGQRLHYSCNSGYALEGSPIQQCLEGGSWSPRIPPRCIKIVDPDGDDVDEDNYVDGVGSINDMQDAQKMERRCAVTPNAQHATVIVRRGHQTANGALAGTELELQCDEGYRDARAPCQPSLLRCVDGTWQGTLPACERVSECMAPPSISNGALFSYAAGPGGHSDNDVIPRYPLGSQVAYKCLARYQLRGDFILSCDLNGCWEPDELPVCYPDTSFLECYTPRTTVIWAVIWAAGVMLALLSVCGLIACRRRCKSPWWAARRAGVQAAVLSPPPSSVSHHHHHGLPLSISASDTTGSSALSAHDPDRLALIAFADGIQNGQSALPSYEEAIRERTNGGGLLSCRPHRPHWPALGANRRSRAPVPPTPADIVTRQSSCTSHSASMRSCSAGGDPMGSTDTMTPSEVSTNVTLDTVSSHTCSSGSQVASCRAMCGSLASFDTSSVINTEGVPLLEESEQEDIAPSHPPGSHMLDHPASDNVSFKFRHASPDLA